MKKYQYFTEWRADDIRHLYSTAKRVTKGIKKNKDQFYQFKGFMQQRLMETYSSIASAALYRCKGNLPAEDLKDIQDEFDWINSRLLAYVKSFQTYIMGLIDNIETRMHKENHIRLQLLLKEV